MNYTDKPVIPLIDAASTSLLNNGLPVLGGALAHCVGRLHRINEAAQIVRAAHFPSHREAAVSRLLAELRWLGPLE